MDEILYVQARCYLFNAIAQCEKFLDTLGDCPSPNPLTEDMQELVSEATDTLNSAYRIMRLNKERMIENA